MENAPVPAEDLGNLRSQIATSSWGGRRYRPYAFTGQGVAMLSSVLRSERAIRVNIAVIRAFVQLRHLVASHEERARRLDELEARYDEQFRAVFEAIRALIAPSRRPIGFGPPE